MGIKGLLIKKYLGMKVKANKCGHMTLKFSDKISVQDEFKNYDSLITRGAKLLEGVRDLSFNYIENTIDIVYSKELEDKKVLRWAETIIETLINNIDYINDNWQNNIDDVINKIEKELNSKKINL